MTQEIELQLPEPGKTSYQVVGDHIIFLYLNYDECIPNPLDDCDGFGTIYSFNRRHVNFKHPDEIEKDDDQVLLSYFEHGQCRWGVHGTMSHMPDFRWDGVSVAGVWQPDDYVRGEADRQGLSGEARQEWMREQAVHACDCFTKWCNGEVYFCTLTVYEARYEGQQLYNQLDDYRVCHTVMGEGFGGCYDIEELLSAVKNALTHFQQIQSLDVTFEVKRS